MPRHHVIISGTGRAGTTFLVQLLTEIGLHTGFPTSTSEILPSCHAGMERDLRVATAPYIVKSPLLCDHLEQALAGGDVVVDHAIVPIRDLYAAAESRRDVVRRNDAAARPQLPGGLWHTDDPAEQEAVLVRQLYKLLHALGKHAIPLTLLYFPRLARDPEYLFRSLAPIFPGIDPAAFVRAFEAVSRPELIHDFAGP